MTVHLHSVENFEDLLPPYVGEGWVAEVWEFIFPDHPECFGARSDLRRLLCRAKRLLLLGLLIYGHVDADDMMTHLEICLLFKHTCNIALENPIGCFKPKNFGNLYHNRFFEVKF